MELDFMFEANVFGFESSVGNFLLTHSQMQYHGENLSNSRIIVRVKWAHRCENSLQKNEPANMKVLIYIPKGVDCL